MSASPRAPWTVCAPREQALRAWRSVECRVRGVDLSALDPDELVDIASVTAAGLPDEVLRAAHRYRCGTGPGDVLLLRGLVPPDVDFGPTPGQGDMAPEGGPAQCAALYLLAVMSLVGEPFNFRTFYRGLLVQQVVPTPGKAYTQTGESSAGMLDWHVEDGFSLERCDHFGLLCVRGAAGAETLYACARDIALPEEVLAVLREPRFLMLPDTAHTLAERRATPMAVVHGRGDGREICFDAHYLSAVDGDDAAADALARLRGALDGARLGHELIRGDLLILDNRRVVHARSSFRARYDGTDRWLMRTMVCACLPRYRRRGQRIIDSLRASPDRT